MTIDEAIKHARDKANEQRYYSQFEKVHNSCIKCAEEHEQLVSWLEELKELKSIDEDLRLKYCYEDLSDADNWGYLRGYNEAIDDFIKKLEEHEHKNWIDNLEYGITWNDIEQIAKELKECAE